MLEVMNSESSKIYNRNNWDKNKNKSRGKYEQMKRFHYNHWIHVYIYAFLYVHPVTIPEGNTYHTPYNLSKTARKCTLKYQFQNVGLYLAALF